MRTLLVLGRVSNLPTVWSNCLAAWLLAGGGSWERFALLSLGGTLLYTGGMFLNDAVDQPFDRRYRPERPIVSGRISARAVWIWSVFWLVAGWAVFLALGKLPAMCAAVLLAAIVLYDLVHKRTGLAPVLMGLCRVLLYITAAAVANGTRNSDVWLRAAALGLYVTGLSSLARVESTGALPISWMVALLFVPSGVAFVHPHGAIGLVLVVALLQVTWAWWCLLTRATGLMLPIPRGIGGLLAGIVLVDWLAAAGPGAALVFPCLFLLALVLQRVAPAT